MRKREKAPKHRAAPPAPVPALAVLWESLALVRRRGRPELDAELRRAEWALIAARGRLRDEGADVALLSREPAVGHAPIDDGALGAQIERQARELAPLLSPEARDALARGQLSALARAVAGSGR